MDVILCNIFFFSMSVKLVMVNKNVTVALFCISGGDSQFTDCTDLALWALHAKETQMRSNFEFQCMCCQDLNASMSWELKYSPVPHAGISILPWSDDQKTKRVASKAFKCHVCMKN